MTDQIDSLWPEDIFHAKIETPISILRQQASALGRRTNNALEGEVKTTTLSDYIYQTFFIVAPALDNYRYKLFQLRHRFELYPLTVVDDPVSTIAGAKAEGEKRKALIVLHSAEELRTWLRAVFRSEDTKRVVISLLAQTTEE